MVSSVAAYYVHIMDSRAVNAMQPKASKAATDVGMMVYYPVNRVTIPCYFLFS